MKCIDDTYLFHFYGGIRLSDVAWIEEWLPY